MTTTAPNSAVVNDDPKTPPYAVVGVAAIAVATTITLLLSLGRYGYFGDELYFISAGRRLSFGYADQGPLVPLIAHTMDVVASGSLVALRLPALIATIVGIVVTAQIARELGGQRAAQCLAAAGYATSPFLMVQGSQLATNALDVPLWTVVTWLVIRWVRTRQDLLLIWAGVTTALAVQVKWLVPFLWVCIALGVLIAGPREMLQRKALWIGAGIVAVTMIPSVIWQQRHGWPQLAMGAAISAENDLVGGRLTFVPIAVIAAGLLGGLLLICGIWALMRSDELRPYRFFGLATILLFTVFVVAGGRSYYVAGVFPAAMAAGAVWLLHRNVRWWHRIVAVPLIAASAALGLWMLPWQPERDMPAPSESNTAALLAYAKFGWTELAEATAQAYLALPANERAHAVIVTDSYWQAGALDNYRKGYLPAVYSPNRGWGYFGAPPDSATTVLFVDRKQDAVQALCAQVQPLSRVHTRLGIPGVASDVTIWRCRDPLRPWSQVWPSLMRLD